MTMPESVVAPPVEVPAAFGLYSAARMLPLSGHDEWGITYDVICGDAPGMWPGACRPMIPPPGPITRTITLTLTGAHIVGPPEQYTVTASATVDSGPERILDVRYGASGPFVVRTDGVPVLIADNPTPGTAVLTFTDVATGDVAGPFPVTQAADGSLSVTTITHQVEDPPGPPEKLGGAAPVTVVATPFVVYAAETCLLGFTPQEIGERARRRLALIEQTAVEREFWTGEHGTTPALATADVDILAGGPPVDLVTGLSLLEQWLGETGVTGFIHVNRGAAAVASELSLVERVGSRLETKIGNVWVFGGGYPTSGPAGTAAPPGQAWMFATRQPTVRRTEVLVPGDVANGTAFNFRQNEAFVVAERVVVADFPCKTAAVLVDLTVCRCGDA